MGYRKHAESSREGGQEIELIKAAERNIPESMKFLQQSEGGVVLPGEEHEECETSMFQESGEHVQRPRGRREPSVVKALKGG